jgi:membrane protein
MDIPQKLLNLGKLTFSAFSENQGPLMAAALAYYALFSIAPLIVLSISITTRYLGLSGLLNSILDNLTTLVRPAIASSLRYLLQDYADNAFNNFPAIISFVIMFIGASVVFAQLKNALNQIWGITPKPKRGLFIFLRTQ